MRGRIGEHLDRPAAVDRVAHELLALGDEEPGLVAMLLLLQRADVLHQRIGEARDLLEASGASAVRRSWRGPAREERGREQSAALRPSSASSPDSTPGPSTSSDSRCSDRNEARIA